jgi:hypothetical protein
MIGINWKYLKKVIMALVLQEGSNYEEPKASLEAQPAPGFNNKTTKAQAMIFGTLISIILLIPSFMIADNFLPENLPRFPIAIISSVFMAYVAIWFYDHFFG